MFVRFFVPFILGVSVASGWWAVGTIDMPAPTFKSIQILSSFLSVGALIAFIYTAISDYMED